jgi:hypothetical protein
VRGSGADLGQRPEGEPGAVDDDDLWTGPERPAVVGHSWVIRFFPEYTVEHPLWLVDGAADLDALHLPAELTTRLLDWVDYWGRAHHHEHGWHPGAPADWWTSEQAALPRALASTLGPEFVVQTMDGTYVRSTRAARSPEAAAATRRIAEAADTQRAAIAEAIARGATFTITAGGPPYDGRAEDLGAPERD